MITYEIDQAQLRAVQERLGSMRSKAPLVISRALNKTATTARVDLARRAQEAYTIKSGGFKKEMTIQKANRGNLVAVIHSSGRPITSIRFKYSKNAQGKGGRAARLNVVKGNGLKPLDKGGIKAFIGPNGHIFQREGAARKPIKRISSNSIPKMIGSERHVYGIERPHINQNLNKYMEQQIALIVGK